MRKMTDIKAECTARIEKAFVPALVKARDEVDVSMILHLKEKAAKPKKASVREMRYAAEILEDMAAREV